VSEIFVIGHRNPDTDAICSAIGYAEFKRRTGMPEAVAARCGDTNDRIDFVLRTFGVEPPRFVADVSPRVRDVMGRNLISVLPDTPETGQFLILTYQAGWAQPRAHGAQTQSGISGRGLSSDEPGRPARADLPG
jgi:hypothetical protein